MGIFDHLPDAAPADRAGSPLFDHLPDATPVPETPPESTGAQGWLDYANGLAEKIAQGVTFKNADEAAALLGSGFGLGESVGLRNRQDILKEVRSKEKEFTKRNPKAAFAGEIGGSLLTGAGGARFILNAPSWAGRALRSGLVAAPFGAASDVGGLEAPETGEGLTFGDYAEAAGSGALKSGAAGAVLSGAGSAVGATVGPWATRAAQVLHDQGIRLTPGELLGPYAKRVEDTFTSIPFVNRMLRARQQEGVEDFNRVFHDRTLGHLNDGIGPQLRTAHDALPANIPVGREANQFVYDTLNTEYNRIVPRLRASIATPFRMAVQGIEQTLPRSIRQDFNDAVDRHLFANISNAGRMDGRDVQDAFQGLRDEGVRLMTLGGRNAYAHDLGSALMRVRDMLVHNVAQNSPPQVAQKFGNINRAYKSFVQTRKASTSNAAEFGVFTPAMAHNAVKATDQTAAKGAFSRGTATNQDLTDAAKAVMTRKISDSGTPERTALIALMTGAAAKMNPALLGGFGALGGLYSRPGRAAFQHLATMSPQTRMMIRRAIERANAAMAPGLGEQMGTE